MRIEQRLRTTLFFALLFGFISSSVFADLDDVVHGASDHLLNFGIVVKNPTYTIYRSSSLGKLGLKHLSKVLDEHDLPFPKTIIYMNYEGYAFPFYFAIKEYKLSLSGKYGDFEYFHTFGDTSTYVEGQNPYHPGKNINTSLHFGPVAEHYFERTDRVIDGGMDNVMTVLNLILDPKRQPVLFHCFGGVHRTGMMAMTIRHLQGGFWVDGPKTESHGLFLNPAEYEYTKFNPLLFRKNNIFFMEEFAKDQRFLELQKKYGPALQEDEQVYFGDEENADQESFAAPGTPYYEDNGLDD